jgi:hypothetical protein
MGDYTAARRNKELRQRRKAAGLVEVRLWVRPDQVMAAKQLEGDALLSVADVCEGMELPRGRFGHVSDIVHCIAFLVSTEITGNVDERKFDGIQKIVEGAAYYLCGTGDAFADLVRKGILTHVPTACPASGFPLVIAVYSAPIHAINKWHEFARAFIELAASGRVMHNHFLFIEQADIVGIEKFSFLPCR